MDVVCVGGATIDAFVILHSLQKFSYDKFSNQISFPLGDKIPLDEYLLTLGGNACNVSVGLSRLGMQTALAAEIGNDEFGSKITKTLGEEKVNIELLTKNSDQTPRFNIVLSFQGERTILEEKAQESNSVNPGNLNPKFIYLTSFSGVWKEVFNKAFNDNPNSKFGLNPGPRQIEEGKEEILQLLPKIEILFVNLQEAEKLADVSVVDVKSILEKLKSFGAKIVVITDGRNGSYAIDKEGQTYKIDCATPNQPKERTGAGDSYSSGFLFGYLNDRSIQESMKYGAINADAVIEKVGAQAGLLNKLELEENASKNNLTAIKI